MPWLIQQKKKKKESINKNNYRKKDTQARQEKNNCKTENCEREGESTAGCFLRIQDSGFIQCVNESALCTLFLPPVYVVRTFFLTCA